MIRVLVAENSLADRALLVGTLRAHDNLSVVGEAKSGAEAVSMTKRLRPDVVTIGALDRAPGMAAPIDRLAATRQIMADTPTPIVVTLNAGESEGDAAEVLAAGAVAVLRKPSASAPGGGGELVETVCAMAQVKVVGHRLRKPRASERPLAAGGTLGILAIAASTGGPAALARVLKPLPRSLPVPVVIVQHLASGFADGFARWLDEHCAIEVRHAQRNEPLQPGVAYIGADGAHLRVVKHPMRAGEGASPTSPCAIALGDDPPRDGFRPSASVLFESVAETYGPRALAVILTGMGRDGASGLAAVRAHGGRVIAQDQQTSVVFGMPSVAIQAGLADFVLPIDLMAPRILELLRVKER
jgi:two-component system, chemotaxis family, protein-glutamate methylesterase/glutaminase